MLFAASIYWHLPLMLLVISLVYSATRHDEWDTILIEAFRWGIRMFGFMLLVAGVLFGVKYLGFWVVGSIVLAVMAVFVALYLFNLFFGSRKSS
jgi:hypothetical protein